jgi:hypothetical protein
MIRIEKTKWRASYFLLFIKYNHGDQIKDKMNSQFSTHGRRLKNDIKIDLSVKQWKDDSNGYCLEAVSCDLGNRGPWTAGNFVWSAQWLWTSHDCLCSTVAFNTCSMQTSSSGYQFNTQGENSRVGKQNSKQNFVINNRNSSDCHSNTQFAVSARSVTRSNPN